MQYDPNTFLRRRDGQSYSFLKNRDEAKASLKDRDWDSHSLLESMDEDSNTG